MNFNFDFGPINSNDKVSYSLYGMAIKNADGKFVCLRDGDIVDVSGLPLITWPSSCIRCLLPLRISLLAILLFHNKEALLRSGFRREFWQPCRN